MRHTFTTLAVSFLFFLKIGTAQNTLIPDPTFEQRLIALGLDTAPIDGVVPTANINLVNALNLSNQGITDLTGIEDFQSLRNLNCRNNSIVNLDLTNVTTLENLDADTNLITSVQLPDTVIDVDLSNNQISNLDLTTHASLTILDLSNNLMMMFDSGASDLIELDLSDNQLSSLDMVALSSLEQLNISNNLFTTIDITPNLVLEQFNISGNALTGLNLSANTLLTILNIGSNNLIAIDLSLNTDLSDLDINDNLLTSLELTANVNLIDIQVSNNPMTQLTLGNKPVLERIIADNCDLLTINVTQAPLLEFVFFERNQLSTVDFSQNPLLEWCWIRGNNLVSMDFSNNSLVRSINLSTNQLTSFVAPPSTTTLTYIALGGNQLSDPAILNSFLTFPNLSIVDIGRNQFSGTVPDLTGLPNLSYYIFNNNQFQFGDFENEHVFYRDNITPTAFYSNDPQEKINTVDVINANTGTMVTMTTTATGAQNHYEWFKDGNIITGAPDSPTYIINNVQTTDAGVYHCEVKSDIVVSTNNGQELVLERNDITLNVNDVFPPCTTIIAPANNATNVAISTDIRWNAEPNATGYFISIGTAPGLIDVLNNFDNGNSTTYNPPTDFSVNSTFYVTITPYNTAGNATACSQTNFTTEIIPVVPNCTTIIAPLDNAMDVTIDTDISWNASPSSTGYFISIGTAPGLTDVLNNFDNGSSIVYNPPVDFAENSTFYVTITPYNAVGNAVNCNEESFTTETLPVGCPNPLSILSNQINVSLDEIITWFPASNADSYRVFIGTGLPGASNIFSGVITNATSLNLTSDLPANTEILVEIQAFNSVTGERGCVNAFTFTTTEVIPECATSILPVNNAIDVAIDTDISWNVSPTATGYFISIGTAPGSTDVLNNFDNGNSTIYNPPIDFLEGIIYYVTITPYNAIGNATGCAESNFTTEIIPTVPDCTTIISPANGSNDIAVDTFISWTFSYGATGYFISIGTTPGAVDVLDNFDNGNNVTYRGTQNLPEGTELFVTITPYNNLGNAINCESTSFSTEILELVIPRYFTPNQDGFHDLWTIDDPLGKVKSVSVFDRYGKLLKNLNAAPFLWDGSFTNQQLPSSDYWYQIVLNDGQLISGHFTLKR